MLPKLSGHFHTAKWFQKLSPCLWTCKGWFNSFAVVWLFNLVFDSPFKHCAPIIVTSGKINVFVNMQQIMQRNGAHLQSLHFFNEYVESLCYLEMNTYHFISPAQPATVKVQFCQSRHQGLNLKLIILKFVFKYRICHGKRTFLKPLCFPMANPFAFLANWSGSLPSFNSLLQEKSLICLSRYSVSTNSSSSSLVSWFLTTFRGIVW